MLLCDHTGDRISATNLFREASAFFPANSKLKELQSIQRGSSEELSSQRCSIVTMLIKWPSFHSSSFIFFLSQLTTLSVTHLEPLFCCSPRRLSGGNSFCETWLKKKWKARNHLLVSGPTGVETRLTVWLFTVKLALFPSRSNCTDLSEVFSCYVIFLGYNSAAYSCHHAVAHERFCDFL